MASPCGISSSEYSSWAPRTIREGRESKKWEKEEWGGEGSTAGRQGRERERAIHRSHRAFYDLALEVMQHHCCHILLVKIVTKVGGGGNIDPRCVMVIPDIIEVCQGHIVSTPCGKRYFCHGHIIKVILLWPSLENQIFSMNIIFGSSYFRSQIIMPIIINKFLFNVFLVERTIF